MATLTGETKTWHKITLDFESPTTFSESPETFRDYRLDVTFTNAATGETITVPGFFAADGNASETGATSGIIWRVNFNPPSEGNWSYEASFRTGDDVAAMASPNAGRATGFDGESGSFTVSATDKTGEDFRAKGMILQDEGTHYLQHQGDGDYFVRGGPGIPENFLASADYDGYRQAFDNANDPNPSKNEGNNKIARHQFDAHADDFAGTSADLWATDSENDADGTNVLGAVDYLAAQGQNTIYVLTNTIGGDGLDVGPWVGKEMYGVGRHTSSIANAGLTNDDVSTYDVSKLEQWERTFDYMDERGIYKNVLFQETENERLLNGGTDDPDGTSLSVERKVYMREMIARFGHNNGIQWNLGEENNDQTDQERADMAEWTKVVDPYDHLVVIHTYGGQWYEDIYRPLLDVPAFDGPSFQTGAGSIRSETIKWREESAKKGDPWVLAWDEDSGDNALVDSNDTNPDNTKVLREGFWGHLTAGGSGGNWYLKGNGFGGHSFDQNLDDFSQFEVVWEWTEAATSFFNTYIPFWDMEMADNATSNSNDFVLAKTGEYYVVYAKYGAADDIRLDLRSQGGETFDVFWYDPRNGGPLITAGEISGGSWVTFDDPPNTKGKDWVLFVRNTSLPDTPPSVPPSDAPGGGGGGGGGGSDPVNIQLLLIEPSSDSDRGALSDGQVVDLESYSNGISVAAVTNSSVGSAVFTLDGQNVQTENSPPYALFGDASGDYAPGEISAGDHVLTVSFYSGSNGSGTMLGSETVAFQVVESGSGSGGGGGGGGGGGSAPPEGVFMGQNGTVIIEADSVDPVGSWSKVSFDGETGLLWNPKSSSYGKVPAGQTLSYEFTVDEDGTYYFATHAARMFSVMNNNDRYDADGNQRTDTGNDAYFALTNTETGEVLRAPTKLFTGLGSADRDFQWGNTFDENHNHFRSTFVLEEGVVYQLDVSGRSDGYVLDRMTLNKDKALYNANTPESPRSDGPGSGNPPANQAPDAQNDTGNVQAGDTVNLNVLSNDDDPENDAMTIQLIDTGSIGTARLNGNNNRIIYEADGGAGGTETLRYRAVDSEGNRSDVATVTIAVAAEPGSGGGGGGGSTPAEGVFMGQNGTVIIEAESVDPVGDWREASFDGEKGLLWDAQKSSYGKVPQGETLSYQFTVDENGTYYIATHAARMYSVMNNNDRYDADGNQRQDTGNDAYIAVTNTETGQVVRAPTKLFTGLGSADRDFKWGTTFDHDDEHFEASVPLQAGVTYQLDVTGRSDAYVLDRVTLNKDTALRNANMAESPRSDGPGGGNPPANQAPVAQNDTGNVQAGNSVNLNVLNNDNDPENDAMTIELVDTGSIGTARLNGNNNRIIYEADGGQGGTETLRYRAVDSEGNRSDVVTVTIAVAAEPPPPNQAPVAQNDTGNVQAGNSVNLNVLNNDNDPENDAMTIQLVDTGSMGTARLNGNNNRIIYQADGGQGGTETLRYRAVDSEGNRSEVATVTVTVAAEPPPPNQAPVAQNDTGKVQAGNSVNLNVLSNDSDPENDAMTIELVDTGSIGTARLNGNNNRIIYQADGGQGGTETLRYRAVDSEGNRSDVATVTIAVAAEPLPKGPLLAVSLAETTGDQTIAALTNNAVIPVDDLANTPLTIFAVPTAAGTAAGIGSVRLQLPGVSAQMESFSPYALFGDIDGDFSEGATLEEGTYTVTLTIYSGSTGSGNVLGTETVSFTLTDPTPTNTAPVAVNDTMDVIEDQTARFEVLRNDSDAEGGPLTVEILDDPSKGTASVNNNGRIVYEPNANANGPDSLTYRVVDNGGLASQPATVTIDIDPVNDAPVLSPVAEELEASGEDGVVTLSGADFGTDPDGSTLYFMDAHGNKGGQVTLAGEASILQYRPAPGFSGTEVVNVTLWDQQDSTVTASTTLTVEVLPGASDDPIVIDPPTGGFGDLVKAINIGGRAYTGFDGTVYEADTYSNGRTYSVFNFVDIDNTVDDPLFRSEAWSSSGLSYSLPVDGPGTYTVELDFAEIWRGAKKDGGRVFDISIEGELVQDNFDVHAEVGYRTATTVAYTTVVSDDEIDIALEKVVQNPKLSAIRIYESAEMSAEVSQYLDFFAADTQTDGVLGAVEHGQKIGFEADPTSLTLFGVAQEDAEPFESVTFEYAGQTQTENFAPYAVFGNMEEDFMEGSPFLPGDNVIDVTVHEGNNGTGAVLEQFQFTFTV